MNRLAPQTDGVMSHARARELLLELLTARKRKAGIDPPRKATAAGLARWLHAWPRSSRETQRRQVRSLIKDLREAGHPILGDMHPTKGGYWLGETVKDFADYVTTRRVTGLTDLAVAGQIKRMPEAAQAAGQMSLFARTG